jgi:hypothetical protein
MRTSLKFFGALLFLKGLLFFSFFSFGQKIVPLNTQTGINTIPSDNFSEKCGFTILESQIEKEMGFFGSKTFFESWIDQKIEDKKKAPQLLSRTLQGPRVIPVVVHIIHNGSPVGVGENIPDSQIFSQIRVLNEDFRRRNPDAVRTPAEFLPAAADANIEFVLARQDPNGLPTNGIVRVQGAKTTYLPSDANLIGQISQWNPSEYLNIWVVRLGTGTDGNQFIGFASFPISDLPGLNFSPTPALIDGVTIDYRFFGVGGNASSFSLGRTATHEIGHYLGLRHIWGDGGCGVDDFVLDTPEQNNSNTACSPTLSRFSCGSNDMVQNYMDYTPDACMNLFTNGQVDRFNAVLENSPRRVTLVNNRATQSPQLLNLDLAITRIIQPVDAICELTISPQIEVMNVGVSTVSSAIIEFRRNGSVLESRRFQLNLSTGESSSLTFNPIQLAEGNNQIEFRIIQVNNGVDENPLNDSKTSTPILQNEISLPYNYNIQSFPGDWVITNPDQSFTWQRTNVVIGGQQQQLVYIRHYEYEGPGQLDYFTSPIIDLAKYPNAQLVFEVAHAPYNQAGFQDELIISVSADCGSNFSLVGVNYQKFGDRLETSPPTLNEFIPTSNSQFRTEIFNLSSFKDLGRVRVSIITRNAYGNNIYLKNIRILPSEELRYGVKIEEILVPTPINSGTHTDERVRVTNTGNLPISKFLFTRTSNTSSPQTFLVSEVNIAANQSIDLTIPKSTFGAKNRLRFSVREPNFDQNPKPISELSRFHLQNSESITAPWRQNFNTSTTLAPWLTINPENDLPGWTVIPIANGQGTNNAVRMQNGLDKNSYWLGSPVFDLTVSRQASIFFDLAAGRVDPGTRLSLLASRDGGLHYDTAWTARGQQLSTVLSGQANPNSPGDYSRKYANLTDFAGPGASNVRLAFVLSTSGNNNDPVYLDNFELFLNANPNPVIPAQGSSVLYPNPARDYFNLAFNFREEDEVTIQIISATGAIVHEVDYPRTLNQTYTFSTNLFQPGIYIIRISSNSLQEMKRLLIN